MNFISSKFHFSSIIDIEWKKKNVFVLFLWKEKKRGSGVKMKLPFFLSNVFYEIKSNLFHVLKF